MTGREKEHAFSIELNSRRHLKTMKLGDDVLEEVLIEGFLGDILEMRTIEDSLLEVKGEYGILRIDITRDEFSLP